MPTDVPIGSGRSYALAWSLLSRPVLLASRPWLSMSLTHFRRTVEQRAAEASVGVPSRSLWAELNRQFDLDGIVDFSHAWHVWENLAERDQKPTAWDQELFFGGSSHASLYHEGIRDLARRQLDFVLTKCRDHFQDRKVNVALDLGAGRGVQMSALRKAGLINTAVCIDTPFVVPQSKAESPEHMWLSGDLRDIDTNPIPSVDLIWVGNLLHHYAPNENQAILSRFATKLSPAGRLVVQEYVIGTSGVLGLSAAGLGVHFALTTSQGRNYTQKLIAAMIEEVVPGLELDCRLDGTVSSLLCFRRRQP